MGFPLSPNFPPSLPVVVQLAAGIVEPSACLVVAAADSLLAAPAATVVQRIVNLMGAWHSQLLEVMGAMGIREVRRLRGETGRAIFFDEIDKDTFGKLFQQRETASI